MIRPNRGTSLFAGVIREQKRVPINLDGCLRQIDRSQRTVDFSDQPLELGSGEVATVSQQPC